MFGFLFGLIGSLFVNVARIVLDVVRAVAPIFQAVWNGINFVISRIGENAGRFFRAIAGGLRHVWDGVLRPVIDAVSRLVAKVRAFLERVFAPIRKAFEWVNNLLDTIWTKVISPILDAIEKVRAVLRILAELGVPFAGVLERVLATIEQRIFNAFREVRTWVNTVEGWFDLLLDPRGWIRSTPFLMTVWRYGGNIVNLLAKLGFDPRHEMQIEAFRRQYELTPPSEIAREVTTGEGHYRITAQMAVARLRSRRFGV